MKKKIGDLSEHEREGICKRFYKRDLCPYSREGCPLCIFVLDSDGYDSHICIKDKLDEEVEVPEE